MIPRLRFNGYTCDWRVTLFDELFLFSTGKNIKQDEASPYFKTPCVRYGELYHLYGEVISDVINKTNIPHSNLIFSEGNEILLPSAGEDPLDIGSASALTIKDVAIGRTINVLRPKSVNLYDQIFVTYYINARLRVAISKLAKGNSISNVYNSDLKKLNINLPGYLEQKKIAKFLSTVDQRIVTSEKRVVLLQQYKKSIKQKILIQKDRPKGERVDSYREWKELSIGDVAFSEASPLSANQIIDRTGEYKVYGASGVLQYLDTYHYKDEYIAIVKDGAGAGRISFCEPESSILGTMVAIQPKEGIDKKFLYHLLSMIDFKKYITGSTIPHIYFSHYSKHRFFIPELAEQQRIATCLSAIDDKIENEKDKIELAKSWKRALLQRIFI